MLETRSPVSRVLSRAAIPLGRLSPSASLPATRPFPARVIGLLSRLLPPPCRPFHPSDWDGSSLLPWLASRRAGITCWGVSAKPGLSSLHHIRRLVRGSPEIWSLLVDRLDRHDPNVLTKKIEPHRTRVNYPHGADRLRSFQFIWEQNGKVQASHAHVRSAKRHSPQTGPSPSIPADLHGGAANGWNHSARLLVPSAKNGTAERASQRDRPDFLNKSSRPISLYVRWCRSGHEQGDSP